MSARNCLVVLDATGQLGCSVARAVAASGEFEVRCVTSDVLNEKSQDLGAGNVDVVPCDLNDRSQLEKVLRGAHACFLNTSTDFENPGCVDVEIAHGCLVADVCKSENVRHVIFTSQLHSKNICSIMARHLVAKAEIERYMRDIDLPLTCLILPVYYQDLCGVLRPRTADGLTYNLEIPMGTTPLDMISTEDIGPIILAVLRRREPFLNKVLSVCGDKLTPREMAQILSKHLRPKLFKDKQLTTLDFHKRRASDFSGSADWANMFQFFQRVDQRYNLSATKEIHPSLQSFEDWVKSNTTMLVSVMC
ncbi:hypothetical protein BsWGS_08735 [Bradybaena similaris]